MSRWSRGFGLSAEKMLKSLCQAYAKSDFEEIYKLARFEMIPHRNSKRYIPDYGLLNFKALLQFLLRSKGFSNKRFPELVKQDIFLLALVS